MRQVKFFKIKSILFLFFLFSSAAFLLAGSDYSVIVRTDNDILTYKDSLSGQVPAPAVFNTKLKDFLIKKLMDGELDAVQMYHYMQTFRINAPDSNYVFVTEIDEGPRGLQFYLFYCDSKQNTCSDYVNIDGYFMKNDEEGFESWNGKLIDKPYISFKDVNNDGKPEIIFNRRSHNGNSWNAVETIVMKISNSAKLEKWFTYFSKELRGAEQNVLVKRILDKIDGDSLFFKLKSYDSKTGGFLRDLDDEVNELVRVGK